MIAKSAFNSFKSARYFKILSPLKVSLFTNEEAPYVLTKPIHGSQKKKKHDESGLIVTIEVIPNIEFEKLILSFGEKVKVVSPKKIADLFKSKYISASKLY